jgi:hypothetical protein
LRRTRWIILLFANHHALGKVHFVEEIASGRRLWRELQISQVLEELQGGVSTPQMFKPRHAQTPMGLFCRLFKFTQNVGAQPQAVSADSGYWNPEQGEKIQVQGIDLHVATGQQKHGETSKSVSADEIDSGPELSLRERMKQKLKTEAGRNLYRMRKAIVEPVFGQIKEWRGFRRFSLRGLQKVRAEWKLLCLTHNLLKLFRSGRAFEMT